MEEIVLMIGQIGFPVKLDTVKSWNPIITTDDIQNCKELQITNDMVSIRQMPSATGSIVADDKVTINDQKELEEKINYIKPDIDSNSTFNTIRNIALAGDNISNVDNMNSLFIETSEDEFVVTDDERSSKDNSSFILTNPPFGDLECLNTFDEVKINQGDKEMEELVKTISQIDFPFKLDTVESWTPIVTNDDIEDFKELEITNDIDSIKPMPPSMEDLTYHQLLELIHKYNKKVEEDFNNFDETELKISAINKWLLNRYDELVELDSSALYESYEAKRKGSSYYVVVCNEYTEDMEKVLLELFNDENLIVYYISKNYDSKIDYFSFTDANRIVMDNLEKYFIKSENVEVLRLEKEVK